MKLELNENELTIMGIKFDNIKILRVSGMR